MVCEVAGGPVGVARDFDLSSYDSSGHPGPVFVVVPWFVGLSASVGSAGLPHHLVVVSMDMECGR